MRVDSDDGQKAPRVVARPPRLHPRYWADPALEPMDAARIAAAFEAHGRGEVAALPAIARKRCPKCKGVGHPWVRINRRHRPTARDFERAPCVSCRGSGS